MLRGITTHHHLWLLGEKRFPSGVSLPGNHELLQIAGELGRFPPYFGEKAWLCMNSECHLCSFLPSVFTGLWVAPPSSHACQYLTEAPRNQLLSTHHSLRSLACRAHILASPRPRKPAATRPHSPNHTGVSWLFPGSKPEVTSVCSIFLDHCISLSLV